MSKVRSYYFPEIEFRAVINQIGYDRFKVEYQGKAIKEEPEPVESIEKAKDIIIGALRKEISIRESRWNSAQGLQRRLNEFPETLLAEKTILANKPRTR